MQDSAGVQVAPTTSRGDEPSGVVVPSQYSGGGNGRITREMWLRVLLWFVPIVFASGALFFSIQNMDSRIEEQDSKIEVLGREAADLSAEQRVLDARMMAIEAGQRKLMDKMDKVVDDLGAIREKLGARR